MAWPDDAGVNSLLSSCSPLIYTEQQTLVQSNGTESLNLPEDGRGLAVSTAVRGESGADGESRLTFCSSVIL